MNKTDLKTTQLQKALDKACKVAEFHKRRADMQEAENKRLRHMIARLSAVSMKAGPQ